MAGKLTRLSSSLIDEPAKLCLGYRSDWVLFMLFESSSSVPTTVPLGAALDLGVEGDFLLDGRWLYFWDVGEWILSEMDRLVVIFAGIRLLDGSLSAAFAFSGDGRAAIHRSNQLQPQRGLFGSMNVWFAEFEFLHVCWYKKFEIHVSLRITRSIMRFCHKKYHVIAKNVREVEDSDSWVYSNTNKRP